MKRAGGHENCLLEEGVGPFALDPHVVAQMRFAVHAEPFGEAGRAQGDARGAQREFGHVLVPEFGEGDGGGDGGKEQKGDAHQRPGEAARGVLTGFDAWNQ